MQKTEFFIARVRNRPCLWNQSHVQYRDLGRKDMTWECVAKECGLANGRDAKNQWKKLRDSHREALRRRKPSAGPTAMFLKPWIYEEDMKFLVEKAGSGEMTLSSNDSNDTEENVNYNYTVKSADDMLNIESDRKRKWEDSCEILDEREMYKEERERQRDELLRQIVETKKTDALSTFFDSLCQKTRELPKLLQLRVQREVFESVTKAEEEALAYNPEMIGYMPASSDSCYNDTMHDTVVKEEEEEDYSVEQETENKLCNDGR